MQAGWWQPGRWQPGGGNGLDRELQRLIDGPSPKPKSPAPKPVAPAPSPNAPAPGGSAPTAAPPAPAPAPAPAARPEAGLDDTPVGGLDPNDLGEPTDETNTPVPVASPATPAPAPAPAPSADPEAGLDDTGAAAWIRRIPADRWTPRPPAPRVGTTARSIRIGLRPGAIVGMSPDRTVGEALQSKQGER